MPRLKIILGELHRIVAFQIGSFGSDELEWCFFFGQASLHASCHVIKGEKWVATKWIRDQVQV